MNMVGALLAHFRIRAALTQPELAERLCMSVDKIASMEQGRRPLHIVDAEHIDKVLNTTGALAAAISEMPEQENIPLFSVALFENEGRARSLHWYENHVVPRLLQTEEYARAVFGCEYPPYDEEEFERHLRNRMERQQLLQRTPPPAMSYVIEETALMRPIGGRECLRRQIRHLRALADLPFLALSVMPLDRETHAGLAGPMILIETLEFERLAYSEGQRGAIVIDDPEIVSRLYDMYVMLRSQALTPEATKRLLEKLAGET
ncbi:helix-turn-helix domain-containing protein [Streptomyces sp. 6N223]|uniref:helix-turn-helix domain-containing protein n=1 Tax=Streptomyces sp. 6N223 TaxID=3457412 RepID=UPI003FD47D23